MLQPNPIVIYISLVGTDWNGGKDYWEDNNSVAMENGNWSACHAQINQRNKL